MLVSMTLNSFNGLMAFKKLSQAILRWFLISLLSDPQALYSLESGVKAIMRLNLLDKLFWALQEPFKVLNFSNSPLRLWNNLTSKVWRVCQRTSSDSSSSILNLMEHTLRLSNSAQINSVLSRWLKKLFRQYPSSNLLGQLRPMILCLWVQPPILSLNMALVLFKSLPLLKLKHWFTDTTKTTIVKWSFKILTMKLSLQMWSQTQTLL